MMGTKILFNNKITGNELLLPVNDRALTFGDGLFETIIVKEDKAQLLERHIARLQAGCRTLGLVLPPYFQFGHLKNAIKELIAVNNISENARIRYQVWRKAEDKPGYASQQKAVNSMMQAIPWESPKSLVKKKVGISQKVSLSRSATSFCKTINALPYIIASREREERGLDELILLDVNGYISECTAMNIFWKKDGLYYTPSLDTGCIAGVMRAELMRKYENVAEVKAPPEVLHEADEVFCCNVTGIYEIEKIIF